MAETPEENEIEVTPAMIEAGIRELAANDRLEYDWSETVTEVYRAMARVARELRDL